MKHITSTLGALAMATTVAHAGGIEREPNNVGFLFEKGNYAELSVRRVMPSVSGVQNPSGPLAVLGTASSGDIAQSYTSTSFALKTQVNDQLSFGLLLDQPVGANTLYENSTYMLRGTEAKLSSTAATALLRFSLPNNISVYGGPKFESIKGNVKVLIPNGGLNYALSTNNDQETGYLAGVAYEKPEIALRVALTYASAIKHTFDTVETGSFVHPTFGLITGGFNGTEPFSSKIPQSLSLDFQTGVAKDTLVFGSIRWREWSKFDIIPVKYASVLGPLVDYKSDVVTFNIGLGRRFSENWSDAVTLGHERSNGDLTGNLNPVDGYTSIGLGGSYTKDNMKISAGVTYAWLGDAKTKPLINGDFKNNHLTGVGVKLGFSF